jgi:hypothetical protein
MFFVIFLFSILFMFANDAIEKEYQNILQFYVSLLFLLHIFERGYCSITFETFHKIVKSGISTERSKHSKRQN